MYLDRRAMTKAGINDPLLRESYESCRRLLISTEGRAWGIAMLAVPEHKRPHLWALYGFERWTDEIVDNGDPATRAGELTSWRSSVLADLRAGHTRDPLCRALLHTLRTWDIGADTVEAYLEGMRMSLTITQYPTYPDLQRYIDAVIVSVGRQVLALFEPLTDEAGPHMDALSTAMYLTDTITDVGEDLRWGRCHLPLDELDAFGVTRAELERGHLTPGIRELLRYQIDRTRKLYNVGTQVIDMVHPTSRFAVSAGAVAFQRTLAEVERRDYQVFTHPPHATMTMMVHAALNAGIPRIAARLWPSSAHHAAASASHPK